ncbi:MAG TPA: LytTR family DNA-binding domain-containing protein [Gemmatimonadaceae bacterium]|nr:LytTR family DNA-binding domain-containing protein [Gemmatimonadaceae bacterium]
MKLRSIIVDDEEAARTLIKELLAARPDVEIVGSYGDTRQALAAIRREKPQLLFLDIQMPGRDGFAVLEQLGPEAPAVVFVTAYEQYAAEAFDVSAVDYVLKPLDEERLHRAVDRVLSRLSRGEQPSSESAVTQMLVEMRKQRDDYVRYLPVRGRNKVVLQKVDDVSWFEADGKYVRLHVGADQHVIRHAMHSLAAKLDPAKFIRVSRSSIVNIEHITHLEPWSHGEWSLTMRGGKRVISTHGYRKELQLLLRGR